MGYFVTIMRFVILCHSLVCISAFDCPKECTCSKYGRHISCIGKELTKIPENIPETVTELYLSQNKITTVPQRAFASLTQLTILSLVNNVINKIENEAFEGLSRLEILYLSQNRLTTLQPDMLSGLQGLKKLYVSQNQLKQIPDLGSLKNISRLNFDSNRINSASFPMSFREIVSLTSVNLAHNNISILRSSDLQPLQTTKIAKLVFSNCALKSAENDVFKNLKSLQSLVLSYNTKLSVDSLSNIISSLANSTLNSLDLSQAVNGMLHPTIFSPLAQVPLRTLSLNHIEITTFLVNGTFGPINQLMNLYMSYSMIQFIEPDTLSVLNELTSLDISHSNLVIFPTNLPASLAKLDLSHNAQLKIVSDFVFKNNSKVVNIDFSHCAITSISKKAFYGLRQVRFIDLSHNLLAENSIAIDSFKNLNTLFELDLSHNTITQITTESLLFQGLKQLKILRLDSNNCHNLPLDILYPLTNLRELYLHRNHFGDLFDLDTNGTFLKNQAQLKVLQLSTNGIQKLHNKSFEHLSDLTSLWLANNKLSSWDYTTFSNVTNLTVLDISHNSLSVLKERDMHSFSDGLTINLTGNPFNCWCDLRWFRNWFNNTKIVFSNNKSYACQSPKQYQGMAFLNFNPISIEEKCDPPYLKYIISSSVAVAILMIFLFICIYIKRWKIMLKWYKIKKSCRHCCCGRKGYTEHTNSVLKNVTPTYGPDKSSINWVETMLVEKLEGLEKSCFVKERDIPYGTGLSDQLGICYEAMCESDYIMLVLSEEYLKDGRRKYEMNNALECMLTNRNKSLIVVLFVNCEFEATKLWADCPNWIRKEFPREFEEEKVLKWYENNPDSQELFWQGLEELLNERPAGESNDEAAVDFLPKASNAGLQQETT